MIEFLGSKARSADLISAAVVSQLKSGHIVDLFTGTASIAGPLRTAGFRVTACDKLRLCTTFAEAVLLNSGFPAFSGLVDAQEISVNGQGGYGAALDRLNGQAPLKGYVWQTYSPASRLRAPVERRYFTEANASHIDGMRRQISDWDPLLTRGERALLLTDLIRAASRVSNTAGTFGCYLKDWKARALQPLTLLPLPSIPTDRGRNHDVIEADANTVACGVRADAVYADPPYTKRQYAAYYHVLETIARDDSPAVSGKTGLRPWRSQQSEFCYRQRAPVALESLVDSINAKHLFLSYSEDGHIPDQKIRAILGARGEVNVVEYSNRRYRSNGRLAHQGKAVRERLYHLAFDEG